VLQKIIKLFNSLTNDKNENYIIYSSLWPIALNTNKNISYISEKIYKEVVKKSKSSTFFFPSFTDGYDKNNSINLDKSEITTGFLPKYLSKKKEFKRTKSAFFSFLVVGKNVSKVINFKPKNAWGKKSLYEWFYKENAKIITFGTHPTHCSFTHYGEWLFNDKIDYRKRKNFSGYIIQKKKKYFVKECLFVRNKNVVNDFEKLEKEYLKNGMIIKKIQNIVLSKFSSQKKIEIIKKKLKKNPNYLIKKL